MGAQYTFTLTEHNTWTGGDGRTKTKAMLVNGGFLESFNEPSALG
jgi:hypothetical protein